MPASIVSKKMSGGLVFGSPAWLPSRVEATFAGPGDFADSLNNPMVPAPPDPPADRPALRALLARIGLQRTSGILPAPAQQLEALADRPLRALVLNFLPTQPEFALPAALSCVALDELSAAVLLLQRILAPRRTLIVLDRHDHKSLRLWKLALRRHTGISAAAGLAPPAPPVFFKSLLNRYPQAHPTTLTRTLLGLRLPIDASPSSLDFLLVDPVFAWALGRYLRTGQPFTDRPVQFFSQTARPRLLLARLGESITDFCLRHKAASAEVLEKSQIILNGMLAGTLALPRTLIDSATESITLRDPPASEDPSPCIACGWCVDVCPTRLNPVDLLQIAQRTAAPPASLDPLHGRPPAENLPLLRSGPARESLHCIACGLCSYVCPSRLPLMDETLILRARVQAAVPVPSPPGAPASGTS